MPSYTCGKGMICCNLRIAALRVHYHKYSQVKLIFSVTSCLTIAEMGSRTEGAQLRKTESQQSGNTQNNSEVKNDTQNNVEGYDHKQENHDDGKHELDKQEGSKYEHDNNEGKENPEKDGSQQKSGGSEPGDGNDGHEHPKVSNEALLGPQSPAPRKKYDFEEAMEGMCCQPIFNLNFPPR